jgi:hypothetical protein
MAITNVGLANIVRIGTAIRCGELFFRILETCSNIYSRENSTMRKCMKSSNETLDVKKLCFLY